MICLGIESTAHTFGVGIVDGDGTILANEKDVYRPNLGSGIHPNEARDHHKRVCWTVVENALKKAKVPIEDVKLISIATGAGLAPCLLVGMEVAKKIASENSLLIVCVNHQIAHIEIGRLACKMDDPVMLYTSGGNTQVVAFESGKYRVFGETEDIPLGNLIDAFGREAKLRFPAGSALEELAKRGKKYVKLPYSVKGMDVSYSGMLTYLKGLIGKYSVEDLCFSLQETAFAMVVEVSERAMAHTQKNQLLLTGGVAANKRLQEMCMKMCDERDAKFCTVPLKYSGDNGAMIAWTGILAKSSATKEYSKVDIRPRWRTDDVEITWRQAPNYNL